MKTTLDSPHLDALVDSAIRDRLFPGAVCAVAEADAPLREKGWGRLTYTPWTPEAAPETIYDLASLTKALVTALCCVNLTAKGKLSLEARLGDLVPDAPADKAAITVRHLLGHASGLPAHRPFYESLTGHRPDARKAALLRLLLAGPLIAPLGQRTLYSDLGFMLLGLLIERITERDLDEAARALVFDPLGADGLSFRPIGRSRPERSTSPRIAPTEACPWRGKVLQGEVHDQNAWALGGVAGHAGLFGTAGAVASLLSTLMDLYRGRRAHPDFPRPLLEAFFRRQGLTSESTWALGFDTPSARGSTAGHRFSPESVGHLGFTGTSFWMDLKTGVIVVFLSNRVFPRVAPEAKAEMNRFRARLHDLVREAADG